MRFKQFITEQQFDGKRFLQDCYHVLSMLDISKTVPARSIEGLSKFGLLFRGVRATSDDDNGWYRLKGSLQRQPVDTPLLMHNAMNEVFNKKFGWPVRNGLFTTGAIHHAAMYGAVRAIFPVGEFKFVWSPEVHDVYETIVEPHMGNDWKSDWSGDEDGESSGEVDFQNAMYDYAWRNNNLPAAIESGNEIMIKCDEYYAFPANFNQDSFLYAEVLPLICEEYGK